jgi:predicted component of type VI protein secretion system
MRRRQGFLGRLAQLAPEHAAVEIARSLGFVFNTRKTCGSVMRDFGLGDYETEVNTRHAVETLRGELVAAVREHEPRIAEPSVRLLGRYGYSLVCFELTGRVDDQRCALGVDIDTTTRQVRVSVTEVTAELTGGAGDGPAAPAGRGAKR